MRAVFKREFRSYFSTPIGFVFLTALWFFLGYFFSQMFAAGSPMTEQLVLAMTVIAVFMIPILTMRLMSEDRRQKVDQALLTAPVKLSAIVLGKFLAALAVFGIGFAPTVIFEMIVASYIKLNLLAFIYALFGMMLLGSALIAIGMFVSSLTESSVLAAILSLVINIVIIIMPDLAGLIKITWIANIVEKAAFMNTFQNFGESIFSVPDVVFFLSLSVAFLFLSVRSLEKRRWA